MSNLRLSKLLLIGALSGISLGILSSFLPLPSAKIDFPDAITIGGVSSIKSEELPVPKSIEAIARRYSYPNLQIDTYFISNRATGDINNLLKQINNLSIPKKQIQTKELSGKGFYATFSHNGKTYLSSCINPQGFPTVTDRQFLANRNLYDLNPNRFAIYTLGLADLRDKRCLWVTLSSNKLERVELEKSWIQWLAYWQPRFPT